MLSGQHSTHQAETLDLTHSLQPRTQGIVAAVERVTVATAAELFKMLLEYCRHHMAASFDADQILITRGRRVGSCTEKMRLNTATPHDYKGVYLDAPGACHQWCSASTCAWCALGDNSAPRHAYILLSHSLVNQLTAKDPPSHPPTREPSTCTACILQYNQPAASRACSLPLSYHGAHPTWPLTWKLVATARRPWERGQSLRKADALRMNSWCADSTSSSLGPV